MGACVLDVPGDDQSTSADDAGTEDEEETPDEETPQDPEDEHYLLSIVVEPEGAGTIACDPESDDGMYAAGETVTLAASPSFGFCFDHWEYSEESDENPLSVAMDAGIEITASFIVNEPPARLSSLRVMRNADRSAFVSWHQPSDPDAAQVSFVVTSMAYESEKVVAVGDGQAEIELPLNEVTYSVAATVVDVGGVASEVKFVWLYPSGSVSSITTYDADDVLSSTADYGYDEKGRLVTFTTRSSAGDILSTQERDYVSDTWFLALIRGYDGEGVLGWSGEYTWDDDWRLIQYTYRDGEGTLQSRSDYEWDSEYHLATVTNYDGEGSPTGWSEWFYGEPGLLDGLRSYDEAGGLVHRVQYDRDSYGNVLRYEGYDGLGNSTGASDYEYDDVGLIAGVRSYDGQGEDSSHAEYVHDADGNTTSVTSLNPEGDLQSYQVRTY